MSRLKIYSGPLSMFGAKVEIAAREKGVDFDLVMVPFDFERGYTPRHSEVLRINSKQQVPVLVDGDIEIFDSTQYLSTWKIAARSSHLASFYRGLRRGNWSSIRTKFSFLMSFDSWA